MNLHALLQRRQAEGTGSGADDEQRLRQTSSRIGPGDLAGKQRRRTAGEGLGQSPQRCEDAQEAEPSVVHLLGRFAALDRCPA